MINLEYLKMISMNRESDEKGAKGVYDFSLDYVKEYLYTIDQEKDFDLIQVELIYNLVYDILEGE